MKTQFTANKDGGVEITQGIGKNRSQVVLTEEEFDFLKSMNPGMVIRLED